MMKLGIYKLSQLQEIKRGERKSVAIDLYEKVEKSNIEEKGKLQELILNKFSFSDGTYKRTHQNRFPDFDNSIIKYLKEKYNSEKHLKIHDMAISDGRTSLNFYHKMASSFRNVDFYGSDREIKIYVYTGKRNKNNKIIKDERDKILQIIYPPFVLNRFSPKNAKLYKIKKSVLYPVNFLLLFFMKIPLFQKIIIPINPGERKAIILLNKEIKKEEEKNKNFHLIQYNILEPYQDKFDILRAMNVINTSYFNVQEMQKIINNFYNSLKKEGVLIIGSNETAGSQVNGNIFLKTDDGFSSLAEFGEGTPFKKLFIEKLQNT